MTLSAAVAAVAPRVNPDEWADALQEPFRQADVSTSQRVAAFLGQTAHESTGFTVLAENLNYSAAALCAVWESHFASIADAAGYARQPERIANRVYANRMGNGGEETGDGWQFRGRGLIQVTGRDNYRACGLALGKNIPQLWTWLLTPEGAAASAVWYWSSHGLNAMADTWDILGITRRINGGTNGLAERQRLSEAALAALGEC